MSEKMTYRDAGVDIDAGNEAVNRIKRVLSGRPRKAPGGEVVGGIGGFAGFFRPVLTGYKDPLLVGATDSVGTKILIALEHNHLEGIGQDCVAMCVNDLVVAGVRPIFFLDYIGINKVDPDQIEAIVASIQRACEESECVLIGGEIAEMPAMYAPGHTDLAGFAVGIVDAEGVIEGRDVRPGDVVLGLASSGLHSNGFTLARKLAERDQWKWNETIPGWDAPVLDTVLRPTKLYVKPLLKLFDTIGVGKEGGVKACAHITGGGLLENIPRVIPDGCAVRLKRDSWPEHPIFKWIQEAAGLPDEEMDRTFNRGIGCAVIVAASNAEKANSVLTKAGERVYRIGEVVEREPGTPAIRID